MARPTELKVAPCELKALLDEAAATSGLCGTGASSDNVRFRLVCQGPETVVLDRRLTLRVLVNLLTNARESLSGPGEIELSAGLQSEATGVEGVVFRVRDTGRGMTEDFIRTSLFRPFATTKSAGLGVGLSQCRSIVEALGGAITVESRPGSGTTFSVHLPVGATETTGKNA
jgi:signal transduction histidine kinase